MRASLFTEACRTVTIFAQKFGCTENFIQAVIPRLFSNGVQKTSEVFSGAANQTLIVLIKVAQPAYFLPLLLENSASKHTLVRRR